MSFTTAYSGISAVATTDYLDAMTGNQQDEGSVRVGNFSGGMDDDNW